MQTYWQEAKKHLRLSIPLAISELVLASTAFIGTILVARLGHAELAASALVSFFYITVMGACWGMTTAVCVLVANHSGSSEESHIALIMQQGLKLAVLMSLPVMLVIWKIEPILLFFGQKPELVHIAKIYMHGMLWGISADLMAFVLQQFLVGLADSKPVFWINLIILPVNVLLNYILMFGIGTWSGLGILGIGIGSSITWWILFSLFASYIYYTKKLKDFNLLKHYYQESWQVLKRLWQIGWPVGFMFINEVIGYMAATLMIGRISVAALAAHQIVSQFAQLGMMLIFGMAQATTTRMGQTLARNEKDKLRQVGTIAIILGMILIIFWVCLYWFCPDLLISIDINPNDPANAQVVKHTRELFIVAGVFQLFDSLRLLLAGALRGLQDTLVPMLICVFTSSLLGILLAYLLSFNYGSIGVWSGMSIGVTIGSILLIRRFTHLT